MFTIKYFTQMLIENGLRFLNKLLKNCLYIADSEEI